MTPPLTMLTNKLQKYCKSIHKKNTKVLIMTLVVLLLVCVAFWNRYTMYYIIGNTAFASPVLGFSFYNIETAEKYLTLASYAPSPREWTNYQISRINFVKGDFQRAEYFANKELELYPNNCRTHYIRGLTYGYIERIDAAIADFERFNICFPYTWAGTNDLAWFYFRKGDTKKVITLIDDTLKHNENAATSPWLQNTYGVALMNEGRYLEADGAFRFALYLANNMTEEDWGKAYPGNNPLIYGEGLVAMKKTIANNITLLEKKNGSSVTKPAIHTR